MALADGREKLSLKGSREGAEERGGREEGYAGRVEVERGGREEGYGGRVEEKEG